MRLSFSIDVVLCPCNDIPGTWVTWCPDLDLVSSGDNPEHAVGMLADCVRLAVEDDLSSFEWDTGLMNVELEEAPVRRHRLVQHPLRRGVRAREDEAWPIVESFRDSIGEWSLTASVGLGRLDGSCPYSIVPGEVSVRSRGGIIHSSVELVDYALVPGRQFRFDFADPTADSIATTIPSHLLNRDRLDRLGLDLERAVVLEARNMGYADIVSVRERFRS